MLQLLRGLRDRGHSVTVLARGILLERAVAERFATSPIGLGAVLKYRGDSDLVHAHDARSHLFAVLPGTRVPVVVSRRVMFPIKSGFLSRWKYARPAQFIAISHSVASGLSEAGIKSEAISVVYDGVALPALKPKARSGAVVAVATADPMKGSALLREAGKRACCEILFSDDLVRDLPLADLFVYSTRSEGLGSAALLAMAHAVPVIASRTGGLTEVVEDQVTGLLVENDEQQFAAGIRRLLDDAVLLARLGRAARERVVKQFSLDSMVEGTIGVYEKVLK